MIYTTSSGKKISITKNHYKNTYIGEYLNQNNSQIIYGDSENEVITQIEEMENGNNE